MWKEVEMGIPTGGNLVIPVVLWGKQPPSHTISALALSFDRKTILTGSSEGQICLWEYDSISEKVLSSIYQWLITRSWVWGEMDSERFSCCRSRLNSSFMDMSGLLLVSLLQVSCTRTSYQPVTLGKYYLYYIILWHCRLNLSYHFMKSSFLR